MYTTKPDINEICYLIEGIREGRISRNKNFFTLSKAREFQLFKRAKLLISLIEDLKRTDKINGNRIEAKLAENIIEVSLFNPVLSYHRRVFISKAELDLIQSQMDNSILSNFIPLIEKSIEN